MEKIKTYFVDLAIFWQTKTIFFFFCKFIILNIIVNILDSSKFNIGPHHHFENSGQNPTL